MTIRTNLLSSLAASFLLVSTASYADDTAAPPPAASALVVTPQGVTMNAAFEQQRARLSGALRPEVKTRLAAVSATLTLRLGQPPPANKPPPSVADLARTSLAAAGFQAQDIDTLVMMVMLEAAKQAEQDTKELLADLKANNAAKRCLHELPTPPRDAKADKGDLMRECVKRAVPDISAARLAAVAADQDSLDEVSQQDALKLRLVMERAQKLSAALSNLLKKASDTSESTVSNLK